jgi:NAD(P)-dependent dehydrogenase (short-subunit alcohol dehydrogenase family)
MQLDNATVLITGANRGLGLAFAREALARGARKVYAAARDPARVTLPGVVPVRLDVTRPEDIASAVRDCGDVTLLINNAGIASTGGFLAEGSEEATRAMLETNFFGPWRLASAFAPVLAAHGGGAILNVLSVASWINSPLLGQYGASKSAAWALTNGLRHELREQHTQVLALHAGFIDTDLTRGFDAPKSTPEAIVLAAFEGLAAGADEVLADEITRAVHQGLTAEPPVYLQAAQPR